MGTTSLETTGTVKVGSLVAGPASLSDTTGLINCGTTALQAPRFLSSSDERLKMGIRPLEVGLAELRKLQPKLYQWIKDGAHDVGVIAQEVAEVAPHCVIPDESTEDKLLRVDYPKLVPYLLAWLHHLTDAVERLSYTDSGASSIP